MKCFALLLIMSIQSACTDDVPTPAPNENVVRLEFGMGAGSGIYLGDGIAITNWHIAVSSAIVNIEANGEMSDEDYLVLYNASDDGSPGYAVGPDSNASYCLNLDENYNGLSYLVTEDSQSNNLEQDLEQVFGNYGYVYCVPVISASDMWCDFTEVTAPLRLRSVPVSELLYANMDLDLGVVKLEVNPTVAAQLEYLELGVAAPTIGQRVRIGGYPHGVASAVYEACEVVSTGVEILADPDTIMPSKLEVPSFKINCNTVRHGSSGSAVIDDMTGKVIGLIWTGEFDENENVSVIYATAVSAWKQLVDTVAHPENHSQLAWLLANFGSQ